jgi:DEAD/DEAH box helicase domain-containing protein
MLPNEMEELRTAFTNGQGDGQTLGQGDGQRQALPLRNHPDADITCRGGPCVRPAQNTAARTNIEHTLTSFLLGLIIQMKSMGGIFDPDLEHYIRDWGKVYLLSQKHRMWMPNFGPKTRTPGFVTTRPGMDRFPQLTRSGSRSSWFEWWAYRHFPDLALRQPTPVQRFYGLVFSCLQDHGLVRDQFQDGHHIYGLEPENMLVSNQVVQCRCAHCGHSISGAASDQDILEGMSCLRRGCKGTYESDGQGMDYYGRLYSHGNITRLVAKEHTGLLERQTREELERRFKAQDGFRKPWYPNLLSSTPTLEMGIDIGDLSTTMQCSVPPTQANYIQRIGRSGRKNGNGLNLTVAAGQAHDLYFFASPLEMIAGQVLPPGVFLDASAVLERQYTAFCLDRWIQTSAQAEPVPSRLGTVLDTFQRDETTVFPQNFIHYVHGHQSQLFQGFCSLFAKELSQDSINHLERFVWGDSQDAPGLTYRILVRLYDLLRERRGLKTQVDRLYREIKRRENSPAKDKNYDQEMEELRQERSGLMALIKSINGKDTYNFLTDEGLLPNYAFPEQGIQLRSIIYRKRTERF